MADPKNSPPVLEGGFFSFRDPGRYSLEDDFLSESPPKYGLKEAVVVSPRRQKFHELQETIHKHTTPVLESEEMASALSSKAVGDLGGSQSVAGSAGMSVEEWVKGLNLQAGGKRGYLDHDGSQHHMTGERDLVNQFQRALKGQRLGHQDSVSLPPSPSTSPRLPRRGLTRGMSASNLEGLRKHPGLVPADGPSGPSGDHSTARPSPHSQLVRHSSATDLIPSDRKPTSLLSRVAPFAPQGPKSEPAEPDRELATAKPAAPKGPFSMGFHRWLFTEKKDVQERDVNVISPNNF